MKQALAGIRVVEIGDFVSAPYCAKLFADLGADVVKVEAPHGDSARRYGPFVDDLPDSEASGLFAYLNTNKRSVTLDISQEHDRSNLRRLVQTADIVVENIDSHIWTSLGLSYDWFRSAKDSVLLTSISAFGRQGPHARYRGYGLQAAAGGTFLSRTGDPDRAPLVLPTNQPEFSAGVHAAAATLVALRWRERGGEGQWIDISMQHADAAATSGQVIAAVVYGTRSIPKRGGNRVNTYYPYTLLPVADGYMEFIATQDRQWQAFLQAIGTPEWSQDDRFDDRFTMVQYGDELDQLIVQSIGHLTRYELWELCREHRVPFQPVHRIDEVIHSDHMAERGYFVNIEGGQGSEVLAPGAPYKLSETPWSIRSRAPRLGEHTTEILEDELGVSLLDFVDPSTAAIAAPRAVPPQDRPTDPPPHPGPALPASDPVSPGLHDLAGARSDLPPAPLAGVRVIDLGQVWAGPLVGCYLADFGAEVIRIQTETSASRHAGARGLMNAPEGARAYDTLTRNRLNLALDLNHPGARDVFFRLVKKSDVVIDNFSPRGVRKLGIEYERLREMNPRIIAASLSAAGRDGPWSDLVTYGPSLSALYGIKSLIGYAGEARPREDGAHLDPAAATYACIAVLAALRWRETTGEGQFIDMAQGEAALASFPEATLEYNMNGRVMGPTGNRHRLMAPHGVYPGSGDDAWIAIAVDSDEAWRNCCLVLCDEKLADDPRFVDVAARLRNQDELDAAVATRTAEFEPRDLTERLQQVGVPSYPVVDAFGVLSDDQLEFRRRMARVMVDGIAPGDLFTATPWGLTMTPASIYAPAKDVGTDSEFVLREILAMGSEEIAALTSDGALS